MSTNDRDRQQSRGHEPFVDRGCPTLSITLPRRSLSAKGIVQFAFLLCCTGIFTWLTLHGSYVLFAGRTAEVPERSPLLLIGLAIPATCSLYAVILLWESVQRSRRSATVTVAEGCLIVEFPVILRTRRLQWPLDRVGAIQGMEGLRICTPNGVTPLFVGYDQAYLNELAARLRGSLGIPERLPPAPDEVEVSIWSSGWESALAGLLRIRPGLLGLRNACGPWPSWTFFADRAGSDLQKVNRRLGSHVLFPEDITCRVGEDGSACLHIALPGVMGPLQIWHPECERLEEALAVFWGAREDSSEDDPR